MPITHAMEEEIKSIRANVRKLLEEAEIKAKKSGKPLAILVGEKHYSPASTLLELVLIQESQRLGVRTMGIEKDPASSYAIKDCLLRPSNLVETATLFASHAKFDIHKIDKLHAQTTHKDSKIDERNTAMVEALSQIPKPILTTNGLLHLEGMMKDATLAKTHTVIGFNVTNNKNHLPQTNVTTLRLNLQASDLTIAELLELGLGKNIGGDFHAYASTHHIPSHKELTEAASQFNLPEMIEKKQTPGLLILGNIHYDLGNYKMAAEIHAQVGQIAELKPSKKAEHDWRDIRLSLENKNSTYKTALLQEQQTLKFNALMKSIPHVYSVDNTYVPPIIQLPYATLDNNHLSKLTPLAKENGGPKPHHER